MEGSRGTVDAFPDKTSHNAGRPSIHCERLSQSPGDSAMSISQSATAGILVLTFAVQAHANANSDVTSEKSRNAKFSLPGWSALFRLIY